MIITIVFFFRRVYLLEQKRRKGRDKENTVVKMNFLLLSMYANPLILSDTSFAECMHDNIGIFIFTNVDWICSAHYWTFVVQKMKQARRNSNNIPLDLS